MGDGDRLLLCTRVSHTAGALRTAVRDAGASFTEGAPGLFEIRSDDVPAVLAAARAALSTVETDEVRALVLSDQQGLALTASMLAAPTLTRLGARADHADVMSLLADEVSAFRSVYQPIVRLDDASVVAYEALLRATGPHGQVMPDVLFGSADEAGWLHVLDRVGRTTALRHAADWLGERQLFVNFLPTTIYRPEVCLATTEKAAERAGLRLDQLVFEVTESERVTDLDHLEHVFSYYRERGCLVALDDLGAGFSSLNMLVRVQPDVVKLDKDIVQRLPDTVSSAVVAAVVAITHAYGGLVLAECIETADQARAALDLGVDLGQGWHFGRPQERSALLDACSVIPSPAPAPAPAAAPGEDGNDPAVSLFASWRATSGGSSIVSQRQAAHPAFPSSSAGTRS